MYERGKGSLFRNVFRLEGSEAKIFRLFPDEAYNSSLHHFIDLAGGIVLHPGDTDPSMITVLDLQYYVDKKVGPPSVFEDERFVSPSFIYDSYALNEIQDVNKYRLGSKKDVDVSPAGKRNPVGKGIETNKRVNVSVQVNLPDIPSNNSAAGPCRRSRLNSDRVEEINLDLELPKSLAHKESKVSKPDHNRAKESSRSSSEVRPFAGTSKNVLPRQIVQSNMNSKGRSTARTDPRNFSTSTDTDDGVPLSIDVTRKKFFRPIGNLSGGKKTPSKDANGQLSPTSSPSREPEPKKNKFFLSRQHRNMNKDKSPARVSTHSESKSPDVQSKNRRDEDDSKNKKSHGNNKKVSGIFRPPTTSTPKKPRLEVNDSSDEDIPVPPSPVGSNFSVSSTRSRRGDPYTIADGKTLLRYICENNYHEYYSGLKPWKQAEEEVLLPGRTHQSMWEHFRKKVYPNAKQLYGCSEADMAKFKRAQKTKAIGCCKTLSYNSSKLFKKK